MRTIDHSATRDLLAEQIAAFIADPTSWPAAMAVRALRLRQGHAPYSPGNQGLILAQLLQRFAVEEANINEAVAAAIDAASREIAPRYIWAKRGFACEGRPLAIYSRPIPLWFDPTTGKKCTRETPGAKRKTVFRVEQTYCAADVIDEHGATAEAAFSAPELPQGEAREVFERLDAWITAQGWRVCRSARHTVEAGSTNHLARLITVCGDLGEWAAVETLTHEIAHALLHGEGEERPYAGEHRGDMEAEAEAVAYGLMVAFGQADRARSSVRYMVEWTRSPQRVAVAYERTSHVLDAVAAVAFGDADAAVKQSAKEVKLLAKVANQELAAALREVGLEPKGEAWARAKAGEDVAAIAADLAA